MSDTQTLTIARVKDVNAMNIVMGGDGSNPSWDEYLDQFKEEFRPHMLVLRQYIIDNMLIGMTGEQAQDSGEGEYRFSDGQEIAFTWRAWGDLMQAIVDKQEGYMAYYM